MGVSTILPSSRRSIGLGSGASFSKKRWVRATRTASYELIQKKAGMQILPGPIINKSDLGMLVRKDSPDLKEATIAFIMASGADGTLKALAVKHEVPEGLK
jgi:hypothetical protein